MEAEKLREMVTIACPNPTGDIAISVKGDRD